MGLSRTDLRKVTRQFQYPLRSADTDEGLVLRAAGVAGIVTGLILDKPVVTVPSAGVGGLGPYLYPRSHRSTETRHRLEQQMTTRSPVSEAEKATAIVAQCELQLWKAQEDVRRSGEMLRRAIRASKDAEDDLGNATRRLDRMASSATRAD